jgi:hypothetical protein
MRYADYLHMFRDAPDPHSLAVMAVTLSSEFGPELAAVVELTAPAAVEVRTLAVPVYA